MKNPDASAEPVRVDLSADEALVLFEMLSRWEQEERLEISDAAEEHALTRLLGQLETRLVAPCADHYDAILHDARQRLRQIHQGDDGSPAV